MAVFKGQVVLLDGRLVPGNLEGTETVREVVISSGEVFCSGGGADSCFVCLSWFLSAVDLSVVVAHRLEWCLPLQRLHRAFDLHWATLWRPKQLKHRLPLRTISILLLRSVTVLQANEEWSVALQ